MKYDKSKSNLKTVNKKVTSNKNLSLTHALNHKPSMTNILDAEKADQ